MKYAEMYPLSKRMPSPSSSSRPMVLLSSTVMTPSLPTLSMASAIISPIALSPAEMLAVEAICSLVSTSLASLESSSLTRSTAASMPRLSDIGLAPAATFRRPSRTSAWARTVAVVVPSPATSSVFFATSLTSSAPIFSHGSSSSISLAMDTPSLVIVGAPHFFSSTTLRPLGPRVTFTASASWFIPRSRPRLASSSNAIIFAAIGSSPPWRTRGSSRRPRRTAARATVPSCRGTCLIARAGQQNPADLWSRVRPGPQANLRDHDHLFGLRAPVALRDLELDPLSLFEGAVAIRLDRGEVDENVLATVDGDKAVSLVRVEPFDGALSHSKQLPNIRSGLEPRPCHRGTRRSRTDEKG